MIHQYSNFKIIEESEEHILIQDIGPWTEYRTVTNDVENVVEGLFSKLNGRHLYYIDSQGNKAEIVIKNNKFEEFRF